MGAAFLITLVNFSRMLGVHLEEAVVVHYWTWIATGTFSVEAALQLDQVGRRQARRVVSVFQRRAA